jgi:plasmid stability protein
MAAVHVRNVPEPVMAALRERAARHGHSMQQEIRQILQAAAADQAPAAPVDPLSLHTVRTGSTGTWRREEIYGDAGR